jgi:2-keto-4-pentenoate hydratase/2-oxohepta-3-ene-1,7-dioic acid hydratase in catechol pathway
VTIVTPSKIVCVGRNYVAHAREMGNDVPAAPMLFLKPPSAVIGPGDPIVLPPQSAQVEHEAEIGVVIGRRIRRVSPDEAIAAIRGFTCANDVTARDLQKTDGQWGRAKGFDSFCPAGPIVAEGLDWRALEVIGRVNGEERQRGRSAEMHFSIPVLVSFISEAMTLEPGDLILTGTPAGVGRCGTGPGGQIRVGVLGIRSAEA